MFKVGDEVKKRDGEEFLFNNKLTAIIKRVDRNFVVVMDDDVNSIATLGHHKLMPVYPNKPHKHQALIKAWADGAVIEYFSCIGTRKWEKTVNNSPAWHESVEYRIKPQISERDKEINKIQEQMQELQKRMEALKDQGDNNV